MSGLLYKFKYKLPDNISGRVLLQWYYITANSCSAPGYNSYPFPLGWDGAPTCPHIPDDGKGVPEQFWNCGEVLIADGSPTGSPVSTPTTNPAPWPTTKSPTKGPTSSPVHSPSSNPVTNPTGNPTSNPVSTPTVTPPSNQVVVGYYQSWQQYDRGGIGLPQNMDFTKLDRVNFAYFQTDISGNIFGTDSFGDPLALFGHRDEEGTEHCSWDAPNDKTCNRFDHSTGLISLVHAAGAKIYLSIGGWTMSDNFAAVASSASARANFANQCAQVIQEYDFDGIDIDWEYPENCDKMHFNLLLNEVRLKLDNLGSTAVKTYGLTAALPCGPSNIDDIDIPYVSTVVDEILLISHDLHGPWDELTGVHAPLYYQGFGDMQKSVDSCVQTWKNEGASPSKIAVGLSFYGRSYAYAMGLDTKHSGNDVNNWALDEGIPPYHSIMDKMAAMTSVRHDVSKTQFAFFDCGDGLVSYDDERAICEKTQYTVAKGLRGLVIRDLSGDLMLDFTTPLLDMVNAKLQNPTLDCANGEPETNAPSPSQTFSPTAVRTPTVSPTPGDGASCTRSHSGLVSSSTCSHFQHCISGHLFGDLVPCPVTTKFDETLQVCNYDYSVWCNGIPPEGVPLCPTGYSGLIAENDCTGFRICTNGIVTSPFTMCAGGSGLLFNEATQQCEWPGTFTCGSTIPTTQPSPQPPITLPTKSPTIIPTVSSTSKPTASPTVSPTISSMSEPTASPTVNPTVRPTANPINPTANPTTSAIGDRACPNDYTGKLASKNCAGYFQCLYGTFVGNEMFCQPGLEFNEAIQNCDWPYSFTCAFKDSVPSPQPPSSSVTASPTAKPTKNPTVSPTIKSASSPTESPVLVATPAPTPSPTVSPPSSGEKCPANFVGFIAMNECKAYRRCVNGAFTAPLMFCSAGLRFNELSQNCGWPSSFTCGSKRRLRGSNDN